jgi:hypothetical protein
MYRKYSVYSDNLCMVIVCDIVRLHRAIFTHSLWHALTCSVISPWFDLDFEQQWPSAQRIAHSNGEVACGRHHCLLSSSCIHVSWIQEFAHVWLMKHSCEHLCMYYTCVNEAYSCGHQPWLYYQNLDIFTIQLVIQDGWWHFLLWLACIKIRQLPMNLWIIL